MNLHEYLRRLLEEIAKKQQDREINENLARICKELDGYSTKIADCLSKEVELPQTDVDKIHGLNDEYNAEFEKYKKLIGLK
jgi:uncharacterized coiled-coil DUF342 family protein